MASDSEAASSPATLDAESVLEFNGRTVHSFTYQTGDSVHGVPNPDDDDDSGEDEPRSCFETLLLFFLKSTPFARATRMLLTAALLAVCGLAVHLLDGDVSVLGVPHAASVLNCSAFVLGGYAVLLIAIHTGVILAHRQPLLYNNELLHWFTEFEEYVAAGTWCVLLLLLCINASHHADLRAHPGVVVAPLDALPLAPWFLRVYLLAGQAPTIHIRLLAIGLVVIVLFAAKRHFMHKLAIEFNYSNYCDRVSECLFVERILQALVRARQTYRVRKRWRMLVQDGPGTSSSGKKRPPGGGRPLASADSTGQPRNPPSTTSLSSSGPASPQFAAISSPSNPSNPASLIFATEVSPSPPPVYASASAPAPALAPTPTPTPTPTPATTSTSDKKRQFEEFSRLANRTAAQFDSLTGADIRVEIHREARRQAAHLYKWLNSVPGTDVSTADLAPFIEQPDDLVRFCNLIRCNTKQQQSSPATPAPFHFTESDLRRTIDASLQERHGLAKSMETIEMALGKINSILNGVLLVLTGVLVALLLLSEAISTLLAISTVISSATFVFATTAKNTFESVIFLLVIHPFDVGDRVYIQLNTTDARAGGDPNDNLVVVEMHLMSTIFERWDGVRIYVPNHILAYKPVYNIRRSGPTNDLLRMSFAHSTPLERIETLRSRLQLFLRQNRQDYNDFHRINIDTLENCNKMNVTVIVQHASNWQDLELQMTRRTRVLSWLKENIEELGIQYLPPVQRIQLLERPCLSQ